MSRMFVITGGPGAGKTTLLHALAAEGYKVIPETARKIIRKQLEIQGNALPWGNKEYYTNLMIEASILSYNTIIKNGLMSFVFLTVVPWMPCVMPK